MQTITMYPNSFPSGTVIEWRWPNTPALYKVDSYPTLAYGTYTGFKEPITNVTAKHCFLPLLCSARIGFSYLSVRPIGLALPL